MENKKRVMLMVFILVVALFSFSACSKDEYTAKREALIGAGYACTYEYFNDSSANVDTRKENLVYVVSGSKINSSTGGTLYVEVYYYQDSASATKAEAYIANGSSTDTYISNQGKIIYVGSNEDVVKEAIAL